MTATAMRDLADIPVAEVCEAVKTAALADRGPVELNWSFLYRVSEVLGGNPAHLGGNRLTYGRVTRALRKLAEDGTLIRTSRGEERPDGRTASCTVYWTPAAFKDAEERHAREVHQRHELEARWDALCGRMLRLGYHVTSGALEISEWERLAEETEYARRHGSGR